MLKDKFKKLREKAGISQQEVATKAGLSWSLIAQIEQGNSVP
jgi:transcriptional regulator with XRE-family HTH domain